MTSTSTTATYLLVHPRVERRDAAAARDRRRSERFVARVPVALKSHGGAHCETVDVSCCGFLAIAPHLPLRQPLMLTLSLPDGPLPAMGVVARHTQVGGRAAIGVQLLGLNREREERWLRAIASLAEARHAETLVARELFTAEPRPLRAGEYSFVGNRSDGGGDDIDHDIDRDIDCDIDCDIDFDIDIGVDIDIDIDIGK